MGLQVELPAQLRPMDIHGRRYVGRRQGRDVLQLALGNGFLQGDDVDRCQMNLIRRRACGVHGYGLRLLHWQATRQITGLDGAVIDRCRLLIYSQVVADHTPPGDQCEVGLLAGRNHGFAARREV